MRKKTQSSPANASASMVLAAYDQLFDILADSDLEPWVEPLQSTLGPALLDVDNGHLPKWTAALTGLPKVKPSSVDLNTAAVRIGRTQDLDTDQAARLPDTLHAFRPWRKGPFDFFGTSVDTEWRSDLKWNRLIDGITSLDDRLVLDIGSGNGYHCWRMAGAGAKLALGADPFLLYVMQYLAARQYLPDTPAFVVPFGIEDLPPAIPAFDTVFSMGVLYHRRSPIDHLFELKSYLRPGGELVLETLVVDGPKGFSLVPDGRYAKMKNVWFIPSADTLAQWLARCRYHEIKLLDISQTTTSEQRRTEWMVFESLADYLDREDSSKTVEGYPAPKRAIFTAKA